MKKTLLLIAAVLTLNCFAGDDEKGKKHQHKYCAKMENGTLKVEQDGVVITNEVTLANGTIIKPDGTIQRKDGTSAVMKQGECIDVDGKKCKKDKPKS